MCRWWWESHGQRIAHAAAVVISPPAGDSIVRRRMALMELPIVHSLENASFQLDSRGRRVMPPGPNILLVAGHSSLGRSGHWSLVTERCDGPEGGPGEGPIGLDRAGLGTLRRPESAS